MQSALRAAAVAAAIAVVVLLTFIPPGNGDFWLHAAIGRIIWTSGEIPAAALFAFTEAAAFAYHAPDWLASVALYLLYEGLGRDRLIFVNGALGLVLFGLAWRLAFRLTAGFVASLLAALALMAALNYRHYLGPELFALVLTLLVLVLLAEYRSGRKGRYLVACVPVALLWANSHGSFPVALVLAAAFAAGAAIEARSARAAAPYLACGALMALAMLVNPYGVHVFRFAGEGTPGFTPFAAVACLYPLSAALRPLAAGLDRSAAAQGALVAMLAACVAVLLRYGNLYGGYPYSVASQHFSGALIEYVEARKFEGNVLNSPALGGELVYRFYPRLRPAVDPRVHVYGRDYLQFLQAVQRDEQALREFVARYRVRYILLLWPDFEQGIRRMPRLQGDGWRIVFADHTMVMLERT